MKKFLFNSHGMQLTGRFIEGRITHYLKFSVKITTKQLHFHFRNKVPFLEQEVSRFNLKQSNSLISRNTLSLK
jgi:hypothetical protein